MLYDFRCDDCGQVREVMCTSSEIMGRVEQCHCGYTMRRIYYPLAFTGDLPGKGNIGYYDRSLGAEITSGKQRKRLMEQQGLSEFVPDNTFKEVEYIRKNGDKKNLAKQVNDYAGEAMLSDRKKRISDAVSKSVDEAVKSVSA